MLQDGIHHCVSAYFNDIARISYTTLWQGYQVDVTISPK
jgi:hypothetical protein